MPRRVNLSPPPSNIKEVNDFGWRSWFNNIFTRVGGDGPSPIQGYVKAALPDASVTGSIGADPSSSLIFVSDDVGGAVLAFSDGTNWRRVTDRAVIA